MVVGYTIAGAVVGWFGMILLAMVIGTSIGTAALLSMAMAAATILAAAIIPVLTAPRRSSRQATGGDDRRLHSHPRKGAEHQPDIGLIVGGPDHGGGVVRSWTQGGRNRAMTVHDCSIALDWIEDHDPFFTYVIIDEGYIGAAESRLFCEAVRNWSPGLPIILLSDAKAGHRLGTGGGALADAVLRKPVEWGHLTAALAAAAEKRNAA